ncbi:outer membrane protein assembly factor BamB [Marinomonas mediterranea]|jgi:outer membrane assembly lipoprotein YfgL|uniref:Outer membrane protein assembly factor BamB n=1 Tax=Marinomonas mediterranea (strain ATCC 700492 / JCM 21426 / NBRC 103028 / MMB-1) TaxID=717774 RepID=F2JUT6_MARM1|nr:outer membrane protein assembly factor BamB [Marinomonas mediterranea]ADZ90501.1 outer membrane assembly lipoprotein YfgL [Marinomonas mediterranea MMB-1]WCN08554.1 outer membrane protein assembly factor BamB [Marinomonas mediterranea]WCN12608.1 outer membrane protein assembly factor BamB [Marinomonas mediterranea]WCN16680.1 outer membrane protein assembly factor BamB [Marinomonas mediterranea MMB-1]
MSKILLLSSLLIALFLQGCATQLPLPEPDQMDQEVFFDTSWRRGVDGSYGEYTERFNPVLKGDGIFFVTRRGAVYKLRQTDGRRLNYFVTDYEPSAGVALNDDLLYFGTYDAKLVAVSLSTKEVVWERSLTSEILSEPTYNNGFLAVQTGDGWLSVLDAKTGDTIWRTKEDIPALTVRGTSVPVIVGNKVLAGFADGKLKAFSLVDGKALWSYEVGKPKGRYEIERLTDVNGRLVVKGDTVYSVAYNGTLSALSIETGKLKWQRSIPSAVGVAVKNDQLVIVSQDSSVIALNALNGTQMWENREMEERELSEPTFFRDYIAVIDRGGFVFLLDPKSGDIKAFKLADTNQKPGSRMVSNGKQLFILTPDSKVTALSY